MEPQRNYKPGYPIEKRGVYYLARSLSSQLSLITEHTDYNLLEKCYSIWICRDHIPPEERYSISHFQMENNRNYGTCYPQKENYDLPSLIVIRLGKADCALEEGMEKGIEQGIELGKANQLVGSVASLTKSLGLLVEDACLALNIELCDYERAKERIILPVK
ncbi:MAG: hypothetical protein HFI69_07415 [Lachnospiraceae bacterium]|nr:hypothetical protein [Lachnospiraceae bacterium]